MEKKKRLTKIKSLITSSKIENQEQLLEKLNKEGCFVTQATLSRDLKQLRVSKFTDEAGSYHYSMPGIENVNNEESDIGEYRQDLKRGFVSLSFSGNICMIKTLVGHANSVASAIDYLKIYGILGTVAGDDTIFMLLDENVKRSAIEKYFGELK